MLSPIILDHPLIQHKVTLIREKNTVAATVGDHEINSVVMSYYYMDTINSTYTQWQSAYGESIGMYMQLAGLDLTKPLDQQTYDAETGETWAEYFMNSAMDRARADYVMYDMAVAEGFTLPEEDQVLVDNSIATMEVYASMYGFNSTKDYMVGNYGRGANLDSYLEYVNRSALASAYYNNYSDSLVYDDAALRAYEEGIYENYNAYSYATYYLSYASFLPEEAAEDPTDKQVETATAEAKTTAESLLTATNVDELDAAIAALPNNAENTNATSSKFENNLYPNIGNIVRTWITDPSRQENDIAVLPNETVSTDEEGNETTSLLGYYVVQFHSATENLEPLANVRHLLVKFEGGTTGEDGTTLYSADEIAAAKAEASKYLNEVLLSLNEENTKYAE